MIANSTILNVHAGDEGDLIGSWNGNQQIATTVLLLNSLYESSRILHERIWFIHRGTAGWWVDPNNKSRFRNLRVECENTWRRRLLKRASCPPCTDTPIIRETSKQGPIAIWTGSIPRTQSNPVLKLGTWNKILWLAFNIVPHHYKVVTNRISIQFRGQEIDQWHKELTIWPLET